MKKLRKTKAHDTLKLSLIIGTMIAGASAIGFSAGLSKAVRRDAPVSVTQKLSAANVTQLPSSVMGAAKVALNQSRQEPLSYVVDKFAYNEGKVLMPSPIAPITSGQANQPNAKSEVITSADRRNLTRSDSAALDQIALRVGDQKRPKPQTKGDRSGQIDVRSLSASDAAVKPTTVLFFTKKPASGDRALLATSNITGSSNIYTDNRRTVKAESPLLAAKEE